MKTIRPSIKQILSMAEKLHNKFGASSLVTVDTWRMNHKDEGHVTYRIYVEDKHSEYFDSWAECLEFYNKIMEEAT